MKFLNVKKIEGLQKDVNRTLNDLLEKESSKNSILEQLKKDFRKEEDIDNRKLEIIGGIFASMNTMENPDYNPSRAIILIHKLVFLLRQQLLILDGSLREEIMLEKTEVTIDKLLEHVKDALKKKDESLVEYIKANYMEEYKAMLSLHELQKSGNLRDMRRAKNILERKINIEADLFKKGAGCIKRNKTLHDKIASLSGRIRDNLIGQLRILLGENGVYRGLTSSRRSFLSWKELWLKVESQLEGLKGMISEEKDKTEKFEEELAEKEEVHYFLKNAIEKLVRVSITDENVSDILPKFREAA